MKRLRSEWLVWALAAAAILAPAGGARTQDPGPSGDAASCPPDVADLSPTEYLKALSLDLRGVVPTVAEYEAISAGTDPASLVDEWLASDDFAARAVRRHRALLWDNISNVRLVYNRARLSLRDGVYWRAGAARYYGRLPPGGVAVPCLDEPATFNPDGTPVTRVVDGVPREGWVEVAPYWDPATPIHVCAFDAQTARTSPMGTDCSTRAAHTAAGGIYSGDPGCGCGPNLIWCDTAATHTEMVNAMTEDVERRIAAIVREDRPYTELFTSRRAYVRVT